METPVMRDFIRMIREELEQEHGFLPSAITLIERNESYIRQRFSDDVAPNMVAQEIADKFGSRRT